jgi:S-adenosylmethionine:tRNA ribosyltransferase-isomerase
VLVSDFKFDLPEELIAQEPLADRAGSRLLHLDSGKFYDRQFREFPELLRPDDLLVFNNTRVFAARLYGRRAGGNSSGQIEVLLTKQVSREPNEWQCLVRPGRKIGVGEQLSFGDEEELSAEVMGRGEFGERTIRFREPTERGFAGDHPNNDFFARVEKIGHIPLPPYIARVDSSGDRERYQTVYAREQGSVAAPTAGLHFTPDILARIRARGIETAEITLHVGLGTFQPVRVERVEDHRLHSEVYSISQEVAAKINSALRASRRVVAVGTTSVRTLEFAATDGEVRAGSGEANLFIYPGYKFRVAGAMLTNFHLPESSLLMLVCALGGKENVLRAYEHAVKEQYRFYSYGDCMLVE